MVLTNPNDEHTRHGDGWRPRVEAVVLVFILLLSAALRLYDSDSSLWGDEISTYQRSENDFQFSLRTSPTPILGLMIHVARLLGDSEMVLRIPSLVAGVLGVAAMYAAVRALAGPGAATISALLLAMSPFHVFHSQHARYYALLMLAYIGSFWLCVGWLRYGGRLRYFGAVLAVAFGFLVHQFATVGLGCIALGCTLGGLRFPTGRESRSRLGRVIPLGLVFVLGAAPFLALSIQHDSLPWRFAQSGVSDSAAPDSGSSKASVATGVTARRTHVLRAPEYLGHLRYLVLREHQGGFLIAMLSALALRGLLRSVRESLPLALTAVSTLTLPYCVLSQISVSHVYAARYFCFLLPFVYGLAGLGLMCLATDIGALARRFSSGSMRSFRIGRSIACVVLIAMLATPAVAALRTHFERNPGKDWKGYSATLARTIRPDDSFYYIDPDNMGAWRFRTTTREYYLPRLLSRPESVLFGVRERTGAPTLADLLPWSAERPDGGYWFVSLRNTRADQDELFHRLRMQKHDFTGLTLWGYGPPTLNLIRDGGFEAAGQEPPGQDDRVVIVGHKESYAGQYALRLRSAEPDLLRKTIRVNTPADDAVVELENYQFERLDDGAPYGWGITGDSKRLIADSTTRGTTIGPGDEPVELYQAIRDARAPGRTLAGSLLVSGVNRTAFSFYLLYLDERTGEHERKLVKNVFLNKKTLDFQVSLPEHAASEGLMLAIQVGETDHACTLQNFRLRILKAGASLNPDRVHTLSLYLKYKDLRLEHESTTDFNSSGSILLAYHAEGEDHWIHLERFFGSADWHFRSFTIEPGVHIPKNASWLLVAIQIYGTGTIWADNLQLEAQPQPTPFTTGVRLPFHSQVSGVHAILQ